MSCLSHTEQDVSNLHPRPSLQEETVVYSSIKCVVGETGTAIGFFFLSCLLYFTSCFLYKMFISCLPYRLLKKRWLTEEKVELLQLKTTVSLGIFLGLNNLYLLLLFF